jgi:hypothetical protein
VSNLTPNLNRGAKPDPFTSRRFSASVDLDLVKADGPQRLTLSLFSDAHLTALRDRIDAISPERYTWYGTVEGEQLSSVVLSFDNGRLAGTVRTLEGSYAVFPATNEIHTIAELNQTAFPVESEPLKTPRLPRLKRELVPRAPANETPVVDVMIVYTSSVVSTAGGYSNLRARIALAVDETNAAYAASGVVLRIRLVHSYETSYVSGGMNKGLNRLTKVGDGYLDDVHAARDKYGAGNGVLWTRVAFE